MSSLCDKFSKSCTQLKNAELEAARQNFFIAAKMNGSDDASVAGVMINQSGRDNDTLVSGKKKRRDTVSDLLMIQDMMIDKYGEDFAEQFGAELLDEQTFEKLMKIEDPEERRAAIAAAIIEGIENGTIDPADAYKNSDVKDWLDAEAENFDQRNEFDHSTSLQSNNTQIEKDHLGTDTKNDVSAFDKIDLPNLG